MSAGQLDRAVDSENTASPTFDPDPDIDRVDGEGVEREEMGEDPTQGMGATSWGELVAEAYGPHLIGIADVGGRLVAAYSDGSIWMRSKDAQQGTWYWEQIPAPITRNR